MNFGEVLRELLDERGITQKQFAQDLNIAVSTVGNYIRDNREPDYKTLKRMADYFNLPVDYLLDHPHEPVKNHREDRLLHLCRILPPETQDTLLDIAAVLVKRSRIK